jgi:hypothetical protein
MAWDDGIDNPNTKSWAASNKINRTEKRYDVSYRRLFLGDKNYDYEPIADKIWLNLSYQRREFWTKEMGSKYIDSIMLGLPLQAFTLIDMVAQLEAKDANGKFLITGENRKELEEKIKEFNELMSFDCNNRVTTPGEAYVANKFKWYPSHKHPIEVRNRYPNGVFYKDLESLDEKRLSECEFKVNVISGYTYEEIYETFLRWHTSGATNDAEYLNAMNKPLGKMIAKTAADEYDSWQEHISQESSPKPIRFFKVSSKDDTVFPNCYRFANDDLIRRAFSMYSDYQEYGKYHARRVTEEITDGKPKTPQFISNKFRMIDMYTRSAELTHYYLGFVTRVWSQFVKIWNANLDDEDNPIGDMKDSDRSDILSLLIYLDKQGFELNDPLAFWSAYEDMQDWMVDNRTFSPQKVQKWVKAKTKKKREAQGLKNPRVYCWMNSRGSAWRITGMNERLNQMAHYLEADDAKRETQWLTSQAIKCRRTAASSMQDHMELFDAGVCAPNVTLEDAEGTGRPCEVDHFIPLARGGRDDLSNFWLVLKDDNRDRLTTDWLEYWEEEYGEADKGELFLHLYKNKLFYLFHRELSFAGKECSQCKEMRPWSDYALDNTKSHPDGVKSDCQDCRTPRERKLKEKRLKLVEMNNQEEEMEAQ